MNDNISIAEMEFKCTSITEMASVNDVPLYYTDGVLVSSGFNKHNEYFSIEELWIAKNTILNKYLCLNHDETKIVGHIQKVYVTDFDNKILDESLYTSSVPNFDIKIWCGCVLYSDYKSKDNTLQANKLASLINTSDMFFSMECKYNSYDYILYDVDSDEMIIIPQTQENKYLDRYLKTHFSFRNGVANIVHGPGTYEGKIIGRYLKGIRFIGNALTPNPANYFAEMKDIQLILGDKMSEINEDASAASENVQETVTDVNLTSVALQDKEQEILDLKALVLSLESEKALLMQSLQVKERVNKMLSVGVSYDEAQEKASTFASCNDEQFDTILAMMKKQVVPTSVASTVVDANPVFEDDKDTVSVAEVTAVIDTKQTAKQEEVKLLVSRMKSNFKQKNKGDK